MLFFQQAYRVGGDAESFSFVAELFGGGGLYVDLIHIHADDLAPFTYRSPRHADTDAVWQGDIPLIDGLAIGVQGSTAQMGENIGQISRGQYDRNRAVLSVHRYSSIPLGSKTDLLH